MRLLDAVKAHLDAEGFPIGIGERPQDFDPGRPFAVLYLTSTTFPDEANDVQHHDEAATSLVHVKSFGRQLAQVAGLAERLDLRLRKTPLTVPGHAVQGVARVQREGPSREDTTHPDQPIFSTDAWFRISTAPNISS